MVDGREASKTIHARVMKSERVGDEVETQQLISKRTRVTGIHQIESYESEKK